MNANALSLIFEYSNKFDIPSPPQNEKAIVAHLAKISYKQHIKAMAYNQEVKHFTKVINELREAFGNEYIMVHTYHGNPQEFTCPGAAYISVNNYTSKFSLRTDMYYTEPNAYLPGAIEVFGGVINSIYTDDEPRVFYSYQDLIEAIRYTPSWKMIQRRNTEELQNYYDQYWNQT